MADRGERGGRQAVTEDEFTRPPRLNHPKRAEHALPQLLANINDRGRAALDGHQLTPFGDVEARVAPIARVTPINLARAVGVAQADGRESLSRI